MNVAAEAVSALDAACGLDGYLWMDCTAFGGTCLRRRCLDRNREPDDGTCEGGCRDASGTCHLGGLGSRDAFCGSSGQRCIDCTVEGLICGGFEGGCTDCTQVVPFSNEFSGGGAFAGAAGASDTWVAVMPTPVHLVAPERVDFVAVRHLAPHGVTPALPVTKVITTANMATCNDCVFYYAGCTGEVPDAATCTQTHVAQSGSIDYRAADVITQTFIGMASRVDLVARDVVADAPLAGGGCLDLGGLDWHAGP